MSSKNSNKLNVPEARQAMDKDNEIKIGEATYTVERQFSGKKTLKELLVEHIVSAKKKEDAMNAPDIDEIA